MISSPLTPSKIREHLLQVARSDAPVSQRTHAARRLIAGHRAMGSQSVHDVGSADLLAKLLAIVEILEAP